jgi:hypothetical protein
MEYERAREKLVMTFATGGDVEIEYTIDPTEKKLAVDATTYMHRDPFPTSGED